MAVVARRAGWVPRQWARLRGRGEPGRWDYLPRIHNSKRDRWMRRLRRCTRWLKLSSE